MFKLRKKKNYFDPNNPNNVQAIYLEGGEVIAPSYDRKTTTDRFIDWLIRPKTLIFLLMSLIAFYFY